MLFLMNDETANKIYNELLMEFKLFKNIFPLLLIYISA